MPRSLPDNVAAVAFWTSSLTYARAGMVTLAWITPRARCIFLASSDALTWIFILYLSYEIVYCGCGLTSIEIVTRSTHEICFPAGCSLRWLLLLLLAGVVQCTFHEQGILLLQEQPHLWE